MSTVEESVFQHLRSIAERAMALRDDFEGRRTLLDEYFRLDGESSDIIGEVHEVEHMGRPMEWVCAPGVNTDSRILYIHGGSWVSGSLAGYRALAARISTASNAAVLLVDYRLAPENQFPAGLEDCTEAFLWMCDNGPYSSSKGKKTFICGDSAGGNLTLASFLLLQKRDQQLPDGLVALSPATDFTSASPSLKSCADVDPVIHPLVYSILAPIYLGDESVQNPLASPIFGDFSRSPPMLLQVGSAEVLLDDSVRLADRASKQGCHVELQVWEGMPHVFQGFAPKLEKANDAIIAIGGFIQSI